MENNFRFNISREGFSYPNKPQAKPAFDGDERRAGQFKNVSGIEVELNQKFEF